MTVNCVAGHVRFEPANPSASYLIGFARQFGLRAGGIRIAETLPAPTEEAYLQLGPRLQQTIFRRERRTAS